MCACAHGFLGTCFQACSLAIQKLLHVHMLVSAPLVERRCPRQFRSQELARIERGRERKRERAERATMACPYPAFPLLLAGWGRPPDLSLAPGRRAATTVGSTAVPPPSPPLLPSPPPLPAAPFSVPTSEAPAQHDYIKWPEGSTQSVLQQDETVVIRGTPRYLPAGTTVVTVPALPAAQHGGAPGGQAAAGQGGHMQRQEQELRMAPLLAQPQKQPRTQVSRAAAQAAAESANDFATRCSRRADRKQREADAAARRGKQCSGRLQRDAEDARSEATTAWAAAQAAEAEYQSICSFDNGIRQESSPHPPSDPPPLWRAGTSASSGSGRSRPY